MVGLCKKPDDIFHNNAGPGYWRNAVNCFALKVTLLSGSLCSSSLSPSCFLLFKGTFFSPNSPSFSLSLFYWFTHPCMHTYVHVHMHTHSCSHTNTLSWKWRERSYLHWMLQSCESFWSLSEASISTWGHPLIYPGDIDIHIQRFDCCFLPCMGLCEPKYTLLF